MRAAAALLTLFLAFPFNQALAWWDEGHMQIAYVAYQRLSKQLGLMLDFDSQSPLNMF